MECDVAHQDVVHPQTSFTTMYAGQVIAQLQANAAEFEHDDKHLRELLKDSERCAGLTCEFEGMFMDYSRQRVDATTMDLLLKLASCTGVEEKRAAMFSGEVINRTEKRAVMHMALRAPRGKVRASSVPHSGRAKFHCRSR